MRLRLFRIMLHLIEKKEIMSSNGFLRCTRDIGSQMSSDCNSPDTMFYTVTDCNDQTNVYQGNGHHKKIYFIYYLQEAFNAYVTKCLVLVL